MKTKRRYSELKHLPTMEERFEYLRLNGTVAKQSWGWDRHFNQRFYYSTEWKQVRNRVIARDNGCDLGVPGYEIHHGILIHHMNPIWIEDLKSGNPEILDPEFLITTCDLTHRAIHLGNRDLLPQVPIVRRPGDTLLWRKE